MAKFDQIAAFIKVVEENSFAAAARKLGISTAAISRQITHLEAELGTQLLLRTTRQLSLTEVGVQYYEKAKKTLQELADAEMEILGSQKEATGILKITCSRYFAEEHILPRIKKFMAENPKLRIKFELAERFPDLAAENIDILFGVSMEGPAELVRRRVTSTRYVFCASPAYLKKFGKPKTPADLTQHRYITHAMRKADNIIKFNNGKEVLLNPILWLNDCHAMQECALQGIGIVMLHDYMVKDALRKKKLIEILHEFQQPQQTVYLYYQQSKFLQPKIRKFIDFFI